MVTPADDDVTREIVERGKSRVSGLTLGILGAFVAVAGFGGGVLYERTAAASTNPAVGGAAAAGDTTGQVFGAGGGAGRDRFPGGRPTAFPTGAAGGFVAGRITKVSGSTIVVERTDGTAVTVKTDGSTSVSLTRSGKVSDLATGNSVVVRGETAADGSVTASSIGEGSTGAFGGRGGFGRNGAGSADGPGVTPTAAPDR